MIARGVAEAVFADAVADCDPAAAVRSALITAPIAARLDARRRLGLAIGKAALAMARGAGVVERGLVVTPVDDGAPLPAGWQAMVSAHPLPDERSVAAAEAVLALLGGAERDDVVLALLSGGASALVEKPLPGIRLDEVRAITRAMMGARGHIAILNAVRGALSAVKDGRLAAGCDAPIVTLAASDVIGDHLAIIGSGPTVGPWSATPGKPVDYARHLREARAYARTILGGARGLPVPAGLDRDIVAWQVVRDDHAEVILPMERFARFARRRLHGRLGGAAVAGAAVTRIREPFELDVDVEAARLARLRGRLVAWGEPVLVLPDDHGEGGRAQQLALELAKHLRGHDRSALVIGSDGIDGPPPRERPAPAGAFVDGSTWDAIAAAGIDPERARARCDAGTALAAIGALVVTGPTGVNHADLVILG